MNYDYVFNGLVKRGVPKHVAAGLAWNAEDESSFDPNAVGDNGNAFGLFQHNGPRKKALMDFSGSNQPDSEKQLDFVVHELNTSEKSAYEKMLATKTDAEAAIAANTFYERPAAQNRESRNAKYASRGGIDYRPTTQFDPQSPDQMSFLPSQGGGGGVGVDPALPIYQDPEVQAQYGVEPNEPNFAQKWAREKMPWLQKEGNRDALLAIGSGLLSGDDWASGIGSAGQNLLGLRQQNRQRDNEVLDDAAAFQRRLMERHQAAQNAAQSDSIKRYSLGNVQMPDGTIRADLTTGTDGRVYDASGNPIDPAVAAQIQKVNNSDAFGSKGQMGFNDAIKLQGTLTTQKAGLEAIDRVQDYLNNDPTQGVEKAMQSVDAMYKTLVGRGLTEEQIDRAVAEGDIQALIGQTREAVVGPGVMTEPDAVRVMAALGGDLKSVLSNPDAFKARLSIVHNDLSNLYNTGYEQYDTTRKAFPKTGYIELERYTPKDKAPAPPDAPTSPSVPEVTSKSLPPPNFEGSEEDWRYVTEQGNAHLWDDSGNSEGKGALDSSNIEDEMPSHWPGTQATWRAAHPDVKKKWLESDPKRK